MQIGYLSPLFFARRGAGGEVLFRPQDGWRV